MLAATAIAIAAACPVFAQGIGPSLAHFKHRRWAPEDGAPASITRIAQTPDGYLWLASRDGLYRFDGVAFDRIPAPPGSAMEGAPATALLVDRRGTLWIGYAGSAGVATLRRGHLVDMAMPAPPPQVVELFQTHNGDVWSLWGGSENRMARYRNGRWDAPSMLPSMPPGFIMSLLERRDGALVASIAARGNESAVLALLAPGASGFRITAPELRPPPRLAFDPLGTLWAADTISTRRITLDGHIVQGTSAFPAISGLRVATLAFDRWGGLWGTSGSTGIFHLSASHDPATPTGAVERFSAADGLTGDSARTLLMDREGSIWVGTELGLDQFRRVSVVRETEIPADPGSGMKIESSQGVIYIASQDRLYEVPPGGEGRQIDSGPGPIQAMCAARGGGVWLLRPNDILLVRGDRRSQLKLPAGMTDPTKCSEDRQGRLWMPATGGFWWHDAQGWHQGAGLLAGGEIWNVETDAVGDMVFSRDHLQLVRIQGSQVRVTGVGRLQLRNISAIGRMGNDLLVGGMRGLVRLQPDLLQRIDAARAPWLAGVRSIVERGSGELWFLGPDGISRVSAAVLQRAFVDPRAAIERIHFGYPDGLSSMEQHPGFRDRQGAVGGDGRVWFLTRSGAVYVPKSHPLRNAVPPPVVIESLAANGVSIADPQEVVLPAGTRALTIGYTALSLAVPERVRFRYRLDGADAEWIDPGERREAAYANLGPGHYRFEVIAANNDGVWNREGASLVFEIPPTLFESLPIRLFLGALAGLLLWLLYMLRIRTVEARIRSRMADRQLERERISREMHDTLLQSVQALILRFQLAVDDLPVRTRARPALEKALDRADEVLIEGRERLQNLRAEVATSPLEDILRQLVVRQDFDANIAVQTVVDGEVRPLRATVLDEAVRIAREALFNVWRHASAGRVEVLIGFHAHQFELRIRDDGVGLDEQTKRTGSRPGHLGLDGMRQRARALGGDLSIGDAPGGGTEVVLQVPATIAYDADREEADGGGWWPGLRRAWRALR